MGGAVVGGIGLVVGGMERLVELGAEVFRDAIEGAEKLGEKLLETADDYEHLGIQVMEFSGASGEALSELQEHAERLYGSLDVAGKNTGQVMAQLGSMLDAEASPALDTLTRHVVELSGRFTNLRAQDVGSIFHVFGVGVDDADASLATMLTQARNAGVGLGDLASSMRGDVSEAARELGLSLGQTAHITAELEKQGISGRSAVLGLSNAEKIFAKDNLDFKSGMQEAAKELSALGDTAAGNKLASDLFGGRKWIEAIALVKDYNDAIAAGATAYDAPSSANDEFLSKTQDLENEVEALKHKLEDAFKPFAEHAEDAVKSGLNKISDWFDQHHSEIIADVKKYGDEFIDVLPKIKEFATTGLRILEPFAIGASMALAPLAETVLAIGAAIMAATGYFKEAGDMLKLGVELPEGEGKALKGLNDVLNKIDNIKLDTDKWKDSLNDAADAASSIQLPSGYTPWWPGSTASNPSGAPPIQDRPPRPDAPSSVPGMPGAPSSPVLPPGPGTNLIAPGLTPSAYSGGHRANWDKIAGAESSGNWQIAYGEGPDVTGGLQIATATWLSHGGGAFAPKAYMATEEQQKIVADRILADPAQGPTAWPTTYREHADWFQPVTAFAHGGESFGGSKLSEALARAGFGPQGKDTILSYYTPGEFVWDTDTMGKYGWLIKALHGKGRYFAGGGGDGAADYYNSGAGNDRPDLVDPQLQYIMGIANSQFGLTLTAGKSGHGTHGVDGGWHDSGQAADFSNGRNTDQELAFAQFMFTHFGSELSELIYADPRMPKLIKDGKVVDPGFYGADTLAGHHDHVHVAIKGSQDLTDVLQPGSEPLVRGNPNWGGGGSMPAAPLDYNFSPGAPGSAGSRGSYPGMPGGMSPQQYDEWKRLRNANDRVNDLNSELNKKILEAQKLQAELDKLNNEMPLQKQADKDKIESKQQRLNELNDEINKLKTREIPDAEADRAETQYKAAHPQTRRGRDGAGSAAHDFGSQFLGGVAQSLGFPDIFGGKPPWEFGLFKMATRFISPFLKPEGREGGYAPSGFNLPMPGMPASMAPGGTPGVAPPLVPGGNAALLGGQPGWWGNKPGPGNEEPGTGPNLITPSTFNVPGLPHVNARAHFDGRYAPSPNPGEPPGNVLADMVFNTVDSFAGGISNAFQGGKGGPGGVGPEKGSTGATLGLGSPATAMAGYHPRTGQAPGTTHNGNIHNGDINVDQSITVNPATDKHTMSAVKEAQNSRTSANGVSASPSFQGMRA